MDQTGFAGFERREIWWEDHTGEGYSFDYVQEGKPSIQAVVEILKLKEVI